MNAIKLKLYTAAGAALLILIAALVAWWHERDGRLRAEGARDHALAQNVADSVRLARADSLLAIRVTVTTDTFVRRETRWRDSIVTKWDTVSVDVPAETVRVIVATADSVIQACDAALSACSLRVQSLLSTVGNRDSTIRLLRNLTPPKARRFGVVIHAGPCASWTGGGDVQPAACVGIGYGVRIGR